MPAPPVLEFDADGNLVARVGRSGPGLRVAESNHGITPDSKGNLFIGGNGGNDGHILKFTQDGKFVKQFGFAYASAGSNDMCAFNKVAKVSLDEKANEAYVADGYGNHRVAVIDMDTGKIKRYWGAYGNKPDDTPLGRYNPDAPLAQQFRNPVHCAEPTNDGMVYVCDRPNDRIQVFTKDGKFVKEDQVVKTTRAATARCGTSRSRRTRRRSTSTWPTARTRRSTCSIAQSLTSSPASATAAASPASSTRCTASPPTRRATLHDRDLRGQRLQKFVYKGLAPVTKPNQGTVWPTKTTH